MTQEFAAEWSRLDGAEVIRVRGADSFQVRPAHSGNNLPGMLGTIVIDGDSPVFVPRYPFVDGMSYEISAHGLAVELQRPLSCQDPVASVLAIYPSIPQVPQNLLRLYVEFSQPMSEGYARSCIRLFDAAGVLDGALLDTEYELWDADHRRLTVLLDPGRIKQGLADHESAGYPLRIGQPFRMLVDADFRDATGAPLLSPAGREWSVGPVLDSRVSPQHWTIESSIATVTLTFDRPLDHALLARCLHVLDPAGVPLDGNAHSDDRSWIFTPDEPWAVGEHSIRIDPILEDIAGNSVQRVFDREVGNDGDDAVVTVLRFSPHGSRA